MNQFGIPNPDVLSPTFDEDNAPAGYVKDAPYFGPTFTAKFLPTTWSVILSKAAWVHDASIDWCVKNGLNAMDILKANVALKMNTAKALVNAGVPESLAISTAQATFDAVSSPAAMDYYKALEIEYRASSGFGRIKALAKKPWEWVMGWLEI